MSYPDFPPEILDSIVDFLCGETEALRQCCLVSKSWVPRTRKHLFAVVDFCSLDDIEAWKKTFPDPSYSPAHYTHSLTVYDSKNISIPTFPRLVRLEVNESAVSRPGLSLQMNLAPFYKVPPTLKSLFITTSFALPLSQVFNLIHSFPSLEDLSLIGEEVEINYNHPDDPHTAVPSSPSPPFTGILDLCLFRGIAGTARRLLNLPNGLHFQKLRLRWYKRGDLRYVVELVMACSRTLEFLELTYVPEGAASFRWTNRLS